MRWLRRMFSRRQRLREETRQMAQQVDELQVQTERVVHAADAVLDSDLRMAYQDIIGERRQRNRGRTPERRAS